MKQKEKIKKIKAIINKAGGKFISMPTGDVGKYTRKDLKNLESNLLLYAGALSNIDLLARGKKEIWATCPYCGLKFTKIVKGTEKEKSFWCESCDKPKHKERFKL